MRLTFIDCSCGNTKGFQLADNLAECTSCALPVHIDTPVYHIEPEIVHLDEISAQEQDEMPELADWSTCFDVDNITVHCDEPLHYHHDGCPSCLQRVAI